MAIEDRRGWCRTCGGPAYRHPSRANNIPDRWTHRRTSDWITNPHEVDPIPIDEQETNA
jgi:hypothetical protein